MIRKKMIKEKLTSYRISSLFSLFLLFNFLDHIEIRFLTMFPNEFQHISLTN